VAGAAESSGGAVPDVVAPPPYHPRFPLSDGVRGIAATAIVAVHVWLFTGGFGGFDATLANRAMVRLDGLVSVFFLLSAFLLYRPMIAHRVGGPPRPRVADYAKGRFLRIYPAYWVALTGLAIVPGLVGVFSGDWWAFYSLGFYLDPLYGTSACPSTGTEQFRCGLPQSWTLTAEVTFYAVLPIYAAITSRIARGRDARGWMRAELTLLAGLAAVSVFLNVPPASLLDDPWFRFSFLGHFYWIALGLALAVLSVGLQGRGALPRPLRVATSRPALPWVGALAIYLVLVAAIPPTPFIVARFTTEQFLGIHLAQGALAMLLLIPVVFGNPNVGLPARVLTIPVIAWLGLISYGLYLWHVTIAFDLGFGGADAGFGTVLAGTLLVAIPLAAASYYLIERPLMRLKYRRLRDALRGLPRRMRRSAPDVAGPG
jgi:peptidoglycan/LPS O-acetylase OafA/YrhL